MNQIILFIATSSDGFIADTRGGVDWLPQPKNNQDLEIVGYTKIIEQIDTIAMGSKSFRQIQSFGDWAWKNKQTFVFTSNPTESPLQCVTLINDTPEQFVSQMKNRKSNKDIWLLGGAELAQSFAKKNLIDCIILTLVPLKLTNGIPLGLSFDNFNLIEEKPLMDGMLQKTYLRKK